MFERHSRGTGQILTSASATDSLWRLFEYQETVSEQLSSTERTKLVQWMLRTKYARYMACYDPSTSLVCCDTVARVFAAEDAQLCQHHRELASLLSYRTTGYTYSALDTLLQTATALCCADWDSQHENGDIAQVMTPQDERDICCPVTEAPNTAPSVNPVLLCRHLEAAIEEYGAEKRTQVSVPRVEWRDVGALESAKRDLVNTIQLPLKYPHLVAAGARRSGEFCYSDPISEKLPITDSDAD